MSLFLAIPLLDQKVFVPLQQSLEIVTVRITSRQLPLITACLFYEIQPRGGTETGRPLFLH